MLLLPLPLLLLFLEPEACSLKSKVWSLDPLPAQPDKALLICPLTSPNIGAMRRDAMSAFAQGADAVECRLDFLDALPQADELAQLLAGFADKAIITCRPVREGGRFAGPEDARLAMLAQAAALDPLAIDIEMDVPTERWPKASIIASHHDFSGVPQDLPSLAARMQRSPADVVKIAFTAGSPVDALRALDIVRNCRKKAIVLAMGEAGVVSRILAGKAGAFGTFASLSESAASAPGQPTLAEMKDLYRWNTIDAQTQVYGVIGCPVGHSMSPAIHNAAFAAAGINAAYVPLLVQDGSESFDAFMLALLERAWLNWRGLSVTIPHKENALRFVTAQQCDDLSARIAAINTVTIEADGSLHGQNTDYAAAIDALCAAMRIGRAGLSGRKAAVLGAGGAARAIVAGLAHYGAAVTIYNRTVSRAQALAEEFGCLAAGMDIANESDAEIIINCTPIGMHPNIDASPLPRIPPACRVVFDTIYNPLETLLLRQARKAGCLRVPGLEMFVNQAVAQFRTWTGRQAPINAMRNVVLGGL